MLRQKRDFTRGAKKGSGREQEQEFESRTLDLSRTARMVAGGRRFRFRALVVVGDRAGRVGLGMAKAKDATQAVEKAVTRAKNSLVRVPRRGSTVPSDAIAKVGPARVLLRPSRPGRGIRAGGTVRHVLELAGIADVTAKILSRSTNSLNNARATLAALEKLSRRLEVAKARKQKS